MSKATVTHTTQALASLSVPAPSCPAKNHEKHEASTSEQPSVSTLINELRLDLAKAANDYEQCAAADHRRDAALQQLMRISLFLPVLDIPHEMLRPTTALIEALADVDRGAVAQILKRQRKSADHRIPFAYMKQRGLAAAAVTLFFEADRELGSDEKKLERALKKVAVRIRRWPAVTNRSTKGKGPQSMVEPLRDWRNSAMAGGPDDLDHSTYVHSLHMRSETSHSLSSWADWLLTHGIKLYL